MSGIKHITIILVVIAAAIIAKAAPTSASLELCADLKAYTTAPDTVVKHQPLPGTDEFTLDIYARKADSIARASIDSLDFSLNSKRAKRRSRQLGAQDGNTKPAFVPDPKKALWLALVCPGAGQIYNRKYWKLPIIYGGFIGCTYALLWNQQMYRDYSQAYLDIMDDDPTTASYKNMLPMGYDITGREEQFQKIFRHKRDYYRKYRDMSIFAFFAVYGLSIVDAYVDAQLSTFDISKDLSISVEPASISQDYYLGTGLKKAVGVQCSLNF